MPDTKHQLFDALVSTLPKLMHSGGVGEGLQFPDFDLMPFDYVGFAEKEIALPGPENKINSVSHLKRAVDCELDTFFCVLGIDAQIRKSGLRFEKKLELVRAMGLVSPRSLTKLNAIRNKLEHEYTVPDIDDAELYLGLCEAFVSSLDGYMNMLASNTEMDWTDSLDKSSMSMSAKYARSTATVSFSVDAPAHGGEYRFPARNSIDDYAWAMRIYFLLCRGINLIGMDTAVEELKKAEPTMTSVTTPAAKESRRP